MANPWEDTYTEETESGPWQEFSPVIRDAVPGSLTPPDLVPAVRKIGGELAIGEPGDTHPDIIDRENIPAEDIDQRGFVGPWDEFYDREAAAEATQLPTAFETGRLHSTDLIKAEEEPAPVAPTFEPPVAITEKGPLYKSTIEAQKYGALAPSDLTTWEQFRRTQTGRKLFGPTAEEQELGIVPGQEPGLVPIALSAPFPFTPGPETIAGKALLSGFIGQFIEQAPQAWTSFKAAADRGDWSEAGKIAAQTGFGAAFTALAGKGLHEQLRGPLPEPPPPITGEVLRQPAERGVPVSLGGEIAETPVQSLANALERGTGTERIEARESAGTNAKSIGDLEALANLSDEYRPAKKPTTPEEAQAAAGKVMLGQLPREAIQIAVGLRDQPGSGALDWKTNPEVAKWIVDNAERVGIQEHPDMPAVRKSVESAKAPAETGLGLPSPVEGTVRVYSGGGSSWGSTRVPRAGKYGRVRYVDVPKEVFDEGAKAALQAGSGTPGDVILPNEWVNRMVDLRQDLLKKTGKIKTLPTPEPAKATERVGTQKPISRAKAGKALRDLVNSDESLVHSLGANHPFDLYLSEDKTRMVQDVESRSRGPRTGSKAGATTDFVNWIMSEDATSGVTDPTYLSGVERARDIIRKAVGAEASRSKPPEPTPAPVASEPAPVGERAMGAEARRISDEELWMKGLRKEKLTPEEQERLDDILARGDEEGGGEVSALQAEADAANINVSQKAFGAAAPHEFPQPEPVRAFRQFDGWVGRAKEALQRVKEYFTPPQVGALPEVEIQRGAVLPRLPEYSSEKVIASAPQGMAKVPGLGALVDTRAVAHEPADAAFLARANSVSKGKTFAAMWAQTQWRNRDLFHVEQNPGPNQGSFRLANGQRGYLSDVIEAELADPGSQPITHAQWQWIHNEWKPVLDELRRQMHNEGVQRISTEDMDFDLDNDYFPRPAIGKRTRATTGAGGRPAGRPGAKQFFQKARLYETEQEGARPGTVGGEKEEIIYDPDPISRVSKFIAGAYRAIADHRLANDPSLGAGTVPDYWGIGRQTMAGPAFAGKIYPVEISGKIERQFAQDIRGWVRNTSNVTSAAKALMATADVSAPFIQGAAMFGRNPVRWAKATVNSYRALTDPNFMAKLMEHPRYKELAEGYSQSGGSLLQLQDFLKGLEPGQIATRIPGYGRFLTATGRSYGAFLDLAKLELFDAWKQVAPRSEWPRLVETIENSLFMGRMEQIGMNPHRAIGERLLLFAPSYYRGAAGLISTAFQKGVSGKMARQMLGGYAAASMLVTMSAYLAMGMDWEEIKQRLQPARGKFLKVPVDLGDGERVEVGIGNILTQLVRLSGQAYNYHTSDKPIDTGVEANPYLRFLRGRSAFIPGVAIELATGRDYFGKRITAKESLARHFSPFVFQAMFPRDEASFRERLGDAAFTFFGLNAYAESEYEKARNQMDQTARRISGKPFSQLNVPQRARVVAEFKRSPEFKPRDPSPTDMERIININAERQAKLQQSLGDSAEKLAKVGLKVPGYRSTFQYKGVSVPMIESERERYQEILSEMYRTQISRLNEASLLRRPLVDREKWWSGQAEKIGVEARKRLAAEISANKVK